ncbi:CAP domain-containing protein [Haloferula sargassicola]|uniref:SCP domain-containing protein n=1 Tax=Haloferula sargassicola TaxID=490096 RepID=A0ABP9UMJ1_9BACT
MSHNTLTKVVGAGVLVLLASCASDLDTTRVPVSASHAHSAENSSLKNQLHQSINRYRASIGKDALQPNSGLDRLAQEHCEFMAKNRGKFSLGSENISHYGFNGRVLAAQRIYNMESIAENVAGGKVTGDIPGQLTRAWVASKKHSYNLQQDWDCAGLGVVVTDDGMVYATQIFATRNISAMTLPDRFRQF